PYSANGWKREVRPLMAFRDYHSTTHRNDALDARVQVATGLATVAPYAGLPALYCTHDGDAPHIPRGCIAQTWSVAELLRAAAALGLLETRLPEVGACPDAIVCINPSRRETR